MAVRRPATTTKPFPRLLRLLLLAAMAALLLLLLLLLSPPATTTSAASVSAGGVSPATHIRLACRATRFPAACESTLSNSNGIPPEPTPIDLILAALAAPSAAIPAAKSQAQAILAASSDSSMRATAARDCLDHLNLSARRLAAAAGDAFPSDRLHDARTFAGAALQCQYDCWSALKYVNSTHRVAAAMASVAALSDLTSNALSMIAALQRYGGDISLWAPAQTERDGYWGGDSEVSSVASDGDGKIAGFQLDRPPNATVCKTGECDYRTIQEAVDAAPDLGTTRFLIRIKAGVYEETVRVPFEKTNVAFLGDGMGATVITAAKSVALTRGVVSTYGSATVAVAGDGFYAGDLTVANTAGPGAHQAVALRNDCDRCLVAGVELRGHQDTLYARSGRQLYRRCRVAGTVDFVFGGAAAVFEGCLLEVVPRLQNPEKGERDAVTAQGRIDPGQATGFVFRDCAVNGSAEYMGFYRRKPAAHRVYLGRPWKEYARVVFLGSYLGEMVTAEGWLPFRGEFALKTLFYGEHGSWGPGANASGRVEWCTQIPAEHLGLYSVDNFIQGMEWAR